MNAIDQSPHASLRLPLALLVLVGLIPLAIFLINPWQPLLEHHAFRQTQTAIASYWLMQGGDFLRYLTPVFGYPWTLPMEFPIYQGLVAFICAWTGLPLDFTGRLLSLIFFYAACAPIVICLRPYGWPAVITAIALFVTAPTDLFFGRTFLIETFATMLALSALCSYILFLRSGKTRYAWAFALIGTIAGLQKITTFLPVAAVCGIDSVRTQIRPLLRLQWRDLDLRAPVAIFLSMVLPLVWTLYSDQVKHEGTLSEFLTSSALRDWNFGTLAQRLQAQSWYEIFAIRFLLLGGLVVAVPLVLYAAGKKQITFNREAALFLCAGLLGPLVFFNLHLVHDYYQVGAVVFLACAVVIIVAPTLQLSWKTSRIHFAALLLAIVVANLGLFYRYYGLMVQLVPVHDALAYDVARYVNSHQAESDVTVIFGQDWNSTIPYYSRRYAIMVPSWVPPEMRAAIVRDPAAYAGGRRIGSIVYCDVGERTPEQVSSERSQLFSHVDGQVAELAFCQVKTRS
jgi:hypothetical protein